MNFIEKTIRLQHTDATGFLFFAAQQTIVLEALEEKVPMREWILEKPYALPVVEVYSLYKKGLTIGDRITISLSLVEIKEKSFTWKGTLFDEKKEVAGEVRFTHVSIDRQTRLPIPLPEDVREKINSLGIL